MVMLAMLSYNDAMVILEMLSYNIMLAIVVFAMLSYNAFHGCVFFATYIVDWPNTFLELLLCTQWG